MLKNKPRIDQYLDRYTLPDSRDAARLVLELSQALYTRALCIPLFDESISILNQLQTLPDINNSLVILVVNAPEQADMDALRRTRELLAELIALEPGAACTSHAHFFNLPCRDGLFSVLVMDHCSNGRWLPCQEGVGLARKLANDVAIELRHNSRIASDWLYQTDADASLPDNYFSTSNALADCAAVHLNFTHTNPEGLSLAQQLYDLKLDYYTAGLSFAGSPFAHYSVGSSLVIQADFYVAVRGYPRLSAGEDFHMLNKLAKVGRIAFDCTRTVALAERHSKRVPFGTGPAVAKFEALESPLSATEFYAPNCYHALKCWLDFLFYCGEHQAGNATFDAAVTFEQRNTGDETFTTTVAALKQLDLFDWLQSTLRQNRHSKQAQLQLVNGMDGLKTLRLIHALRDNGLPNVTAATAARWMSSHPVKNVRQPGEFMTQL